MEKEDVSRGTGENNAYVHARMAERDAGVRDATRVRERDDAFLFHRTVETHACHGGGVGGCVVACAREGEDGKRG